MRQVEPAQCEAELVAALKGAQTIIPYAGGAKALNLGLVKQLLPDLRLVQLMSAGFDHVDVNGTLQGLPAIPPPFPSPSLPLPHRTPAAELARRSCRAFTSQG